MQETLSHPFLMLGFIAACSFDNFLEGLVVISTIWLQFRPEDRNFVGSRLAVGSGRQGMILLFLVLAWASALAHQGTNLPWHWHWLLSRGAKASSYQGAGIGFCPGVPRYDLTLALELAVSVGRQTIILPWHRHCLLAGGAKA